LRRFSRGATHLQSLGFWLFECLFLQGRKKVSPSSWPRFTGQSHFELHNKILEVCACCSSQRSLLIIAVQPLSDDGCHPPWRIAAVASNVLDRSFEAAAPNRKWIADFTYLWTAEGWL
jgi:hypothetical protein